MTAIQSPADNPEASPPPSLSSPFLHSTAYIRRGARSVVLYPWHQRPDERPDLERIDEGYAADSVESWFPIDDHHWYFTRDDLGRLFQETTGIRGDLYLRKTTELRRWLVKALDEGEVRAYWWNESEVILPTGYDHARTVTTKSLGTTAQPPAVEGNAWAGLRDEPTEKPEPWPSNEPTSLEECHRRLLSAKERIRVHKFQPKYSDADLIAMRDAGRVDHRFMVWVTSGTKNDGDEVGYTRATERSTVWTAPFTMVEDADLDPALLCAKNGMNYKSDQAYTVIVIDQSAPITRSKEAVTIIPTFENISKLGQEEFVKDGISEADSRDAMTPEFNEKYRAYFDVFLLSVKEKWSLVFDEKIAEQFSHSLGPVDGPLFVARHRYQSQFGANQKFLGNGLTEQKAVLGQPGTNKQYGALEVMTFETNPPKIAQRKAVGGVQVFHIPAKGA